MRRRSRRPMRNPVQQDESWSEWERKEKKRIVVRPGSCVGDLKESVPLQLPVFL
jgi:hypothetical protein